MTYSRYLFLATLVILFYGCPVYTYAQQSKIDSLLSVLKTAPEDTAKIMMYDDVVWEYIYSEPAKALSYANQELALAQQLKWKNGIAIAENSIGVYYSSQSDYANTLVHFFNSLKLREEIKDKKGIAALYCNIGNVYRNQDNSEKALNFYIKALALAEETGNKHLQSLNLCNMGIIYADRSENEKALGDFLKALKLDEETGNKIGASTCLGNVGLIYSDQGNEKGALECYLKAMQMDVETGNKNGQVHELGNIGELYIKQKKYAEAEDTFRKALGMAKALGIKILIKDDYEAFARLDSLRGDYKGAYENYRMFVTYRDSVSNEVTREKNLQLGMQYDFDKKQAVLQAEQNKKDAIADQEKRKQKIVIVAISGGLFLLFVIIVLIFRSLRVTQLQKKIITEKSDQLSEALTSVKDSITYAKRIQQAKLPKMEEIHAAFKDSFVLFRPKDIVSGDFYYFHKTEKYIHIAAVDCTGHGVPGAFMSLISYEKLEEAVEQSKDPSEILKQLNKRIKTSLKQTVNDDSTRDGMDIALCEVNKNTRTIKFAGANRPLWIIRKGGSEVEEIKATKKAIGGWTDDEQCFETHEIQLEPGDAFYLFSDGYADTFNGKTNKKLTTKKMKEVLLSIKDRSMAEQQKYLDDFLESWRSGIDQVDDVLVIGVRL